MSVQEHTHTVTHEHAHGNGVYHRTLILLLILTGVTVGASYVQFGPFNVVIALAIATVKAVIVALFFMHLLHDKAVNAIIAVAGFLFLGIFMMFCLIDTQSRDALQPHNLPNMEKGATPVPETLNPLLAAPPKPLAPAPAKAEGEEHK